MKKTKLKSRLKKGRAIKSAPKPARKADNPFKGRAIKKIKVVKAKRVKKAKEVFDFTNIKGIKIEYFDERFYKADVPKELDPKWLANIPVNYISELSHLAESRSKIMFFKDVSPEYYNDTILKSSKIHILDIFFASVTTIIGGAQPHPMLERARGDIGNWEMDRRSKEAKIKGSKIHDACDKLAKGHAVIYVNPKLTEVTDKMKKFWRVKFKRGIVIITEQEEMIQVARYDRLIKLLKPKIIKSEYEVYNFLECYAGTVDSKWYLEKGEYKLGRNKIIIPESGIYIVDLKSGKWYDEKDYSAQLAAYVEADQERSEIKGSLIVHLNANIITGIEGLKVHVKTREELAPYYQHFLDLKKVYFFSNPAIPKLYEFPQIIVWDIQKGKKK